jgi:hypothetical protein
MVSLSTARGDWKQWFNLTHAYTCAAHNAIRISYGVEEDGTKDKRINDSIQGAQQAHDFVATPSWHTVEAGPGTVDTVDCERLDDEDTDVDELRPPTVSAGSVVVLPPLIEYAVR